MSDPDATALTRWIESTAVNTFRLTQTPPLFVRGAGAWLWEADGTRYLDLVCGSATTALGHGHPAHSAAISEALDSGILHTGTRLASPFRARLYAELGAVLPQHLSTIHLANSGAEAIETAIKAAMFATGRRRFVAFDGGYHGRTLGALALTHSESLRAPFEPWHRPWVTFCPYAADDSEAGPALAALDDALDGASTGSSTGTSTDTSTGTSTGRARPVAGIVIEAVQGVSGVRGPSERFLQGVQERARAHGALLILDEIWSGLGRSGRWFAFEHAGLAPDLVALGKGLSASLPLSAVAGRAGILQGWPAGAHTSTFMGNPLACAAAAATLKTLRADDLIARAATRIAPALQEGLAGLPGPVRVVGAQAAIDMGSRARAETLQRRALLEERILVYGGGMAGECVMLLPPLTIGTDTLADALARLRPLLESA